MPVADVCARRRLYLCVYAIISQSAHLYVIISWPVRLYSVHPSIVRSTIFGASSLCHCIPFHICSLFSDCIRSTTPMHHLFIGLCYALSAGESHYISLLLYSLPLLPDPLLVGGYYFDSVACVGLFVCAFAEFVMTLPHYTRRSVV